MRYKVFKVQNDPHEENLKNKVLKFTIHIFII